MVTAHQHWLVQTSFEKFIVDIDVAARLFYNELFQLEPSLIPMFKGDIQVQGRKLISMILFAVNSLHNLDDLTPQIQLLGQEHASYGVRPEHYPVMRRALLQTLRTGLGRDCTPEVEGAWAIVWDYLAAMAIQGAGPGG